MVTFAQWLARTLTAGERTAGGYSRRLILAWLVTLEAAVAVGVATFGLLFAYSVTSIAALHTASTCGLVLLGVLAVCFTICTGLTVADKPQTGGDK